MAAVPTGSAAGTTANCPNFNPYSSTLNLSLFYDAAAAAAAAAGFNAVRVPMNFTNLQRDIPKPKNDGTEFYACMVSGKATFILYEA